MRNQSDNIEDHEEFKELSALANSGTLTSSDWWKLKYHLQSCVDCRRVHDQYRALTQVGIPHLAAMYGHPQEREHWDDSQAREQLLDRIRDEERQPDSASRNLFSFPASIPSLPRIFVNRWMAGAIAAGLAIAAVLAAYNFGNRAHRGPKQAAASWQQQNQQVSLKEKSTDNLMDLQAARIIQIQKQNSKQEQEIAKLRSALLAAEERAGGIAASSGKTEHEFRTLLAQRDGLLAQLRESEQSFQDAKTELASLRAENDRELLHSASLQSKINDLTAVNRDQERRMGNDEQYLASDRDIRELMGARKLYIADVFDVDSGSRTRKPFGRVFYTQNKSLIFYAFDLDHQAGVKNASIFQVWGQKDAEVGEKVRPMNLGVLYMDSESNRRWVLRLDDAKQLGEIDAVFVTVEPHGGSPKPTGKPFLYALLRKEANHP
ncbi:MAG TPA: hypothetical protein VI386_22955 [Candidatus Sulfotelmatobacter sp.]